MIRFIIQADFSDDLVVPLSCERLSLMNWTLLTVIVLPPILATAAMHCTVEPAPSLATTCLFYCALMLIWMVIVTDAIDDL